MLNRHVTYHTSDHDVRDFILRPDCQYIVSGLALTLPDEKTTVTAFIQHEALALLPRQLAVKPPVIGTRMSETTCDKDM